MDDADRRELQALRARAYGPDADIHSDPVAWARLRELEGPSRASAEQARAAGAPAATSRIAQGEADGAGAGSAEAPPTARRSARRTIAVWAASVLIAAVIGGAVGAWLAPDAPAVPGAGSHATLPVDAGFSPPFWMDHGPDEVRGFREFHGLVPIASTADWTSVPSDICLILFPESQLGGETSSPGYAAPGCGSGPFAAVVSLTVVPESPSELREAFAEGTALHFVLDGDVVRVAVAAP